MLGPHLSHLDNVPHHHTVLQLPHIQVYQHRETSSVPKHIPQGINDGSVLKNKTRQTRIPPLQLIDIELQSILGYGTGFITKTS
jgi:hypothetical protein